MRTIPKEDCKVNMNIYIDKEYPDGVFCNCGKVIHIKNRLPYEIVKVVCPCCNFVIRYGG